MEVAGQVWVVLLVGKYEDVADGGGVSVGVCTVYGLFKSLFESAGCVFWEYRGYAWPGRVSVGCGTKAGIFGVV